MDLVLQYVEEQLQPLKKEKEMTFSILSFNILNLSNLDTFTLEESECHKISTNLISYRRKKAETFIFIDDYTILRCSILLYFIVRHNLKVYPYSFKLQTPSFNDSGIIKTSFNNL